MTAIAFSGGPRPGSPREPQRSFSGPPGRRGQQTPAVLGTILTDDRTVPVRETTTRPRATCKREAQWFHQMARWPLGTTKKG